jgi:hypothetical protein
MLERLHSESSKNNNWDLNQERALWEKLLNQKINFFLILFALIIGGISFAKSKEFSIFILLVGTVILWILTLSIFNVTHKINIVIRGLIKDENHPTVIIDKKARGRIVRIFYGYVLPVFCSGIITLVLLASMSGFYDFNFPTKTEIIQDVKETLEKPKEILPDQKKPEDNSSKYFQNIDSVINKKKQAPVITDTLKTDKRQPVQKRQSSNPNFKDIEKVIKK